MLGAQEKPPRFLTGAVNRRRGAPAQSSSQCAQGFYAKRACKEALVLSRAWGR
jgi:hypothetical protein